MTKSFKMVLLEAWLEMDGLVSLLRLQTCRSDLGRSSIAGRACSVICQKRSPSCPMRTTTGGSGTGATTRSKLGSVATALRPPRHSSVSRTIGSRSLSRCWKKRPRPRRDCSRSSRPTGSRPTRSVAPPRPRRRTSFPSHRSKGPKSNCRTSQTSRSRAGTFERVGPTPRSTAPYQRPMASWTRRATSSRAPQETRWTGARTLSAMATICCWSWSARATQDR